MLKALLILIQRVKYKLNLDRKNYILKYIRKNKPKTILEIGVFNGAFAKRMLLNATNSMDHSISYTGVDLFEDLSSEVHKKEISLWALKKDLVYKDLSKVKNTQITLLKGYSSDLLPLLEGKMKFDLILIDGGHSYETVKSDFDFTKKLVNTNGAIFFDDYVNKLGVVKEGYGINKVVDNLNRAEYSVKISKNIDFFPKSYGLLSIRIVKVQLKNN
jgi:predicted O-methyltransferase YrrM